MRLKEFINHKMRMSHIYQPVMIKTLLLRNGSASKKEIAEEILRYDPTQVEYYENIVNNMVGRVLRSHNIINKTKFMIILKSKVKRSGITEVPQGNIFLDQSSIKY